jgi:hypothetical protein
MSAPAAPHSFYHLAPSTWPVVREPSPPPARPPKLLDRVREANRLRHGSRSTEKSYVQRIRRFILFHGKRHPAEMGAAEVTRFLTSLAVEGRVAASTQNQALSALFSTATSCTRGFPGSTMSSGPNAPGDCPSS